MEDYSHTNNNNNQMNDNSNSGGGGGTPRGSFLYASPVIGGGGGNSSSSTPFHLLNSATTNSTLGFHPDQQQQLVKTESSPASKFHHYSLLGDHHHHHRHHHHHQYQHQQQQQHQQQVNSNNNNNNTSRENSSNTTNNNNSANSGGGGGVGGGVVGEVDALKAKIVSHPHYSNLLLAYMDCQKVGAPAEVVARLAAARQEFESRQTSSSAAQITNIKDPELDQFMEAYYDMLVKYREELTRPIQEAMEFMRRVETQLNLISTVPLRVFNNPDDKSEGWGGGGGGSSEEEQENCSGGETELPEIDPRAEDRELKNHLLRKYSGYLSSLKQELSKKKKKGKLPKEARQKLLSWWELHYKWPYPSESEKVALAETTGLDQKQINNWFINQRKRHWKPSEDMQFMVMDGLTHHPPHHPHHHNPAAALYMDAHHHYLPDGPYRLGP